jgi:hypothetical protein
MDSNTKPNTSDLMITDDDATDLPPEFDPNADTEVPGIDLDEMPIGEGIYDRIREMNPPAGDWSKVSRWELTERVDPEDQMPGDVSELGRFYYQLEGYVEPRVEDGVSYAPFIFFRCSPDARQDERRPQYKDSATKLFDSAMDTFIADHTRKPHHYREFKLYLRDSSYIVNTTKGNSGPFVQRIKSKHAKQRR